MYGNYQAVAALERIIRLKLTLAIQVPHSDHRSLDRNGPSSYQGGPLSPGDLTDRSEQQCLQMRLRQGV